MTVPLTTSNQHREKIFDFGASNLRSVSGAVIHCLTDFVNDNTTIHTTDTNTSDNKNRSNK